MADFFFRIFQLFENFVSFVLTGWRYTTPRAWSWRPRQGVVDTAKGCDKLQSSSRGSAD